MRHRIAAIPGDGIGKEVVPEGMRVLDAAGRRFGFDIEWTTFDWSCERYTETGRMMPEDGLDRLRPFEAIFLGAVGFPGVPGPRLALGTVDPDPARLPSVRQPATRAAAEGGQVAARRTRARGHRHGDRAREQRRRVLGDRRAPLPGHAGGARRPAVGLHAPGLRPHHALRVRAGDEAAAPPRDVGDQVERDHPQHAVLGRALRGHRDGISERQDRPSTTSTS